MTANTPPKGVYKGWEPIIEGVNITFEDRQLFDLGMLGETAYDLVFLDVDMPGMNGFELCTKLRALARNKTTPVVFVTSLTDFESRANSTMSGGNDLIAKPFLFMELAVKALPSFRPRLLVGSVLVLSSAKSSTPPAAEFGATPDEEKTALPPASVQVSPSVT